MFPSISSEHIGCPFCAGIHFEKNEVQNSRFSAEEIENTFESNKFSPDFENNNSPSHNIFINNIANVEQKFVDLVKQNVSAAFDEWAQILWSSATININVTISDQIDALGTGGPASSVYYGNDGLGKSVWQGSAAHNLVTGNSQSGIDINTTFNASWFDRFEFDYSIENIQNNRVDFKGIALHEIAHGLYSTGWRNRETFERDLDYISAFDSITFIEDGNSFISGFISEKIFGKIEEQTVYHYYYNHLESNTGVMNRNASWGKKENLDFLDFTLARDSGLTTIFSDYVYMPYGGAHIDAGPGYNIATFKFIEYDIDISYEDNNTIIVETVDGRDRWVLENFSFIEKRNGDIVNTTFENVDLYAIYRNEFNSYYGIDGGLYEDEIYEIVQLYYEAILRDVAYPAEIEWASGEIESGRMSLEELREELIASSWTQEYVKPVLLTYEAVYGRAPDSGGLDFWVHQYRELYDLNDPSNPNVKEGLVQLLKPFVDPAQTPEFVANYGANPSAGDFVAGAYTNVLNRAPDQGGLAYWTQVYEVNHAQIAQANPWMSAADVAVEARALILEQFVSSPEYETATADAVNAFLHGAALGDTSVYNGSLWDLANQTAMMDFESSIAFNEITATNMFSGEMIAAAGMISSSAISYESEGPPETGELLTILGVDEVNAGVGLIMSA